MLRACCTHAARTLHACCALHACSMRAACWFALARCFRYLSGEDPYLGSQLVEPVVAAIQAIYRIDRLVL
jgi:hypothetical protein